ncbi:MAG: bifunctional [glutamate--ammonia ligase]-adenylyl-L-tyrosine phosphorylase/[glutamate--ammonia-ligase] adenylyltransferase [Pseudomonadales bacterium]|nr:bifunctional [glutamate--ammonia ligase]-adenylyl-L-tyrosine phosphorylase/[glutamate--ammonia-ligase] adenylyltransferase [Pseudomonadales bacterium]
MSASLPQAADALERFANERLEALRDAGVTVDSAPDELRALCLGSNWAFEWLLRRPSALDRIVAEGGHRVAPDRAQLAAELDRALAGIDAGDPAPAGPLGAALRAFRNRQMIAILLRDLARHSDLRATTAALSDLAEVIIERTLGLLHPLAVADWGRPLARDGSEQRLVVVAMGKLGARELNLSSDIDLVFVHPERGVVEGGAGITCQEFFTRLGRRLIGLLDTRTPKGFVFRVDMRLRPFGDSGPLVQHLGAFLTYYEEQGRDWERYAFVKARAITGDAATVAALEAGLRPFVYRRYLDFGAIAALRDMKAMIRREVQRRGLETDVKLGSGGIREVEFVAQVFQLIHGGRDRALQRRGLLDVLPLLVRADLLERDEAERLREAYVFLRELEHRIQALDDAQTQRLPDDPETVERIAALMACDDATDFSERLAAHRAVVARSFTDLIRPAEEDDDGEAEPWRVLWQLVAGADGYPGAGPDDAHALELLAAGGFSDREAALARLVALAERRRTVITQDIGRQRLDALLPLLLEAVVGAERPDVALERSLRLVEAVLRRTAYLVLLLENPGALDLLVRLTAGSERIAAVLARHPILLDELLDSRALLTVPTRESLAEELAAQLADLPVGDLEAQMEQLRYFKVATELRVAACELAELLPLMKVSDALSWLAEVVLEQVVRLAWDETEAQYGAPSKADGSPSGLAFGVVGYGKLGGLELGWGSDLDLVFLHDLPAKGMTHGDRSVANGQFMARMGQRMIHLLSTRTFTGQLYEVDLRLRPSGRSGVLVAGVEAFAGYQRDEAWTWEHQALVRARFVAGAASVASAFEAVRREILGRERDRRRLCEEVLAMRDRMLAEHRLSRDPERLATRAELDLKQDAGAVVDIEFMVQFLVLGWARAHPELLAYTDAIRILETAAAEGILGAEDAETLVESYKAFRAEAHRAALQDQPARSDRADLLARAEGVERLWSRIMTPAPRGPARAGAD